ncbi:MAG: DUF1573 domain-containing protein [Gemmataceae bacterium]
MYLLLALCLSATPPLQAERPTIDRGEVRIGPALVERFTLTNRGTLPLTITNVETSCGCLAPKLDRRELSPGASAILSVEINTLSQPAGPIGWPVRVTYKSGENTETLEVILRAQLISEVRVEPAAAVFRIRNPRSVTLTVTDTRSKPFKIIAVGASSPQIIAELLPGDGTVRQIKVTASPDGPPSTRSEIVWITTDDPLYPQIRVPVTLTILPSSK